MTKINITNFVKISLVISLVLILLLLIVYYTVLNNNSVINDGISDMYITDENTPLNTLQIKENERLNCVNKCIDTAFNSCQKLYDSYDDEKAEKCFNEHYLPCAKKCSTAD